MRLPGSGEAVAAVMLACVEAMVLSVAFVLMLK